nr:hypothetical protein [Tanacetum cinerariifolium]
MIEDILSVVIKITSLEIVPNTLSMIKRRSLFDVRAIVEMIARRKKYVLWLSTTMSFKSSSSSLQEMIEMQKPPKDKHGSGYTEAIASTSSTRIKKLGLENIKMPFVEAASPVPSTREPVRLKAKLESDEWIKDNGCSRHMTRNKDLFSSYKTINEGVFLMYSPNSKANITLNKETMKVEESLNVKFDEIPPPMSPPLEDDDIHECKVIENKEKDLEIKENEPLNKEIINIKESKYHPLETIIGHLNERTLRYQVQNQVTSFASCHP